jgi:large subunit ribosomal protein L13
MMKTYSAKPQDITRHWYVVDGTDQVLGRLAAQIALRLRGKHTPTYTPHMDTGDFIVVLNVEKLKVTGNKAEQKLYHRHTGYPGGIRTASFAQMQARFPGRVLEKAVKGMLPKGPLGYAMIKKLKCYAGPSHPHSAQQPRALDLR